jgi:outer membrane lipoprotein-sorting protein
MPTGKFFGGYFRRLVQPFAAVPASRSLIDHHASLAYDEMSDRTRRAALPMLDRTRKLVFLTAVLLSLPAASSSQSSAISADDLVKKILDARGGAARLKSIKSERVTGNISFGPGAEGPFFVELKRPGKMHMEVVVQEQTIMRIYDGNGSGWIVNPFTQNKGPQPMTGNDLKNIADESDFDGPLLDYQSKGNKIEALGNDEVEGKPAQKLRLTTKSGDSRTYFFDATTFLLLKWEGVRKNDDQEIPVESFFRDYREVNGIKFAFAIDTDSPGSAQTQKLSIEKIELNIPLEEARFAKPAEPPAAKPPA